MKKATYFYGIWCQNGIPFLAPYSAKTEPVLAPYGAKNEITFWHHLVFFELLLHTIFDHFLGYFLSNLILFLGFLACIF